MIRAQLYGGPVDGHSMVVSQLMPVWHVPMRLGMMGPIQAYLYGDSTFHTAEYALVYDVVHGGPLYNGHGEAKYEYRGML